MYLAKYMCLYICIFKKLHYTIFVISTYNSADTFLFKYKASHAIFTSITPRDRT